MKKTITNKTRNLGYGYNFEELDSYGFPLLPNKPNYTGTISQLYKQIKNDIRLQQIKETGIYNWAFFYGDERIVDTAPREQSIDVFKKFTDFLLGGQKLEITTEKVS